MKTAYGFKVEKFNEKMLEAIAANASDDSWQMPWNVVAGGYRNAESGRRYQGVNIFLLAISKHSHCKYWNTPAGWTRMGYTIKQDAIDNREGVLIVWMGKVPDRYAKPKDDGEQPERWILKSFLVFAGTQVEGWETPSEAGVNVNHIEQNEAVDSLYDTLDVRWEVGGEQAFYRHPYEDVAGNEDVIWLPEKSRFHTAEAYDGTRLHELAHWTGHPSRLNRPSLADKDRETPDRAFEELVAESCSAIVRGMLGIQTEPDINTVKYLRHWLKHMVENDKWSLYKALKAGAQAAEWIVKQAGLDVEVEEDGGAE